MRTTIDHALARWAANCGVAENFAAGASPVLGPHLSGWFARDLGIAALSLAELGTFSRSWRAGWRDCDTELRLLARATPHSFAGEVTCETCGLDRRDGVHQL